MSVGLDRQSRWNATEDHGGHIRANRGESTYYISGTTRGQGGRRGDSLPRGRRGGTARAIRDRHLPRTSQMGTRKERHRGRVAAAAHRGTGAAPFHGPEPTPVARKLGKLVTLQRSLVSVAPLATSRRQAGHRRGIASGGSRHGTLL